MKPDTEIPILPAAGSPPPAVRSPVPEPETPPVSSVPSPRQTLTFLRNLFEAHGLEAKSKLGQNYLIDLNLIDLIVRTAEVGPGDAVLEVGTGTGSLTARLADHAGQVVTIEIDKTFHPVARQIVGQRENVTYLLGDCLESKSRVNPDLLTAWDTAAGRLAGTAQRKLVANLPYVIATPLISNLLVSELPIERMVVMVQWEIAERLRATVGTKDYNALSVLVQSIADVETIRKVLPANFHPRPKVDSAIVMIRPNAEKRARVGDVIQFRDFLRDLYTHRRKNLRQGLVGWPRARKDKAFVDARLAELQIDGSRRAEALSLEDHLRLCNAFRQ
ncbi:MAG: 16S rRNA (adenine(1518)-N(6)/adenine(1519)-N(6))-dimethyltransferase RsmA [Bacteroidales bacterium]|nr:16S rRNA (adenine(1518)-N(6)/adenine(1519)-N(6))-dimethyltransferase RsmA [Bacteroidales bacterium]